MNELKSKLIYSVKGPVFTVFTPFQEDYSVDFNALENYISFMYSRGARLFYVMPYNSRYSQLNNQEIGELNKFAIETTKQLSKDNIIFVGDPIHCSTQTSLEFAKSAKEWGADAISLIIREKYFCDQQIIDHLSWIGEATNFPILIHEMPFLSGFDGTNLNWSSELLEKVSRIPQVFGIKEDAKDLNVARFALSLEPNLRVIFAGTKNTFLPLKNDGLQSYLNGISIIDPQIGLKFWDAWNASEDPVIEMIISKLEQPFFGGPVKKYGWHRCNKALLQAAGLMHRRDRMPMPELNENEFEEVCNVYSVIKESFPLLNL